MPLKEIIYKSAELIAPLFLFFAPVQGVVIGLMALLAGDFITGCLASFKKGQKFSSTRMKDSATKLGLYLTVVLVSHTVQILMCPNFPLNNLAAYFIASVELKSIWENLGTALGINAWNFIKQIINDKLKAQFNSAVFDKHSASSITENTPQKEEDITK